MSKTITLKKGQRLFHGTDCDFEPESVEGPLWLSDAPEVARRFARGGRVLEFTLSEAVVLPLIHTRIELESLAEEHGVDLSSPEDIRDTLPFTRLAGWFIPDNYAPRGADVLLNDVSVLVHVWEDARG